MLEAILIDERSSRGSIERWKPGAALLIKMDAVPI